MSAASPVEHDIEFVAGSRRAIDRDYVSIAVWRRGSRPAQDGDVVRAEVYYAGHPVASVALGPRDDGRRLALVHAGAHLDPSAFSIRSDGRDGSIGGRITIEARSRTPRERLASTLPSAAIGSGDVFPAYADMLALRRAVTR
jgi:hypothetical protein